MCACVYLCMSVRVGVELYKPTCVEEAGAQFHVIASPGVCEHVEQRLISRAIWFDEGNLVVLVFSHRGMAAASCMIEIKWVGLTDLLCC